MGPQATEKRVKITAGLGGPRHVLLQACREGSEKHCWGLDGGWAGANMFCPRAPKLTEKRVKNTAGALGGVPIVLSTPDVFCLSSTRHRKVVQNPQAIERRVKWL